MRGGPEGFRLVGVALAHRAVTGDPVGKPLERVHARRFEGEAAPRQAVGRLGTQNGPGRGQPLQARRQVGNVAEGQRLGLPLGGAHFSDDDDARMQADAHVQADAAPGFQLAVEPVEARQDVARGANGPGRFLLVRGGVAEVRQNAVAEVLRHEALLPGDGRAGEGVVLPDQVLPVLQLGAPGQQRRAYDVAKHDRQLAPLAGGRRAGPALGQRSAAAAAKAKPLRVAEAASDAYHNTRGAVPRARRGGGVRLRRL